MKDRISAFEVFLSSQPDPCRLCGNGRGRNEARARVKISLRIGVGKGNGAATIDELLIDGLFRQGLLEARRRITVKVAANKRGRIYPCEDSSLSGRALWKPFDPESRIRDGDTAVKRESGFFIFEERKQFCLYPVKRIVRAARANPHSVYKDQ